MSKGELLMEAEALRASLLKALSQASGRRFTRLHALLRCANVRCDRREWKIYARSGETWEPGGLTPSRKVVAALW